MRRNVKLEVERSLSRWGSSDAGQLSERLGISRRQVEDALCQLRRAGRAVRRPGKPSTWRPAMA